MGADREHYRTYQNVFDNFTYRNIFKLISEGHFHGIESPVSIGKEANIFSAKREDSSRVIVKIYRLETCDFNRMFDYIKSDPRFPRLKRGKRKIIFSWTQREFRNLLKAREAGVRVPLPICFKQNIIVEEYIGTDDGVYPMLKDSHPKNKKAFFDKIIKQMKRLHDANLVHGDLSEFNILNMEEEPVFIDFSQSTQMDDPHGREYLQRDIRNICRFFGKLGYKADPETIEKKIVGKEKKKESIFKEGFEELELRD